MTAPTWQCANCAQPDGLHDNLTGLCVKDCPCQSFAAPFAAQEPADPPSDWLLDAESEFGSWFADSDEMRDAVKGALAAALPILRAGIERELREKLATQIVARDDPPASNTDQWDQGFTDGILESADFVRHSS